MRPRSIVPIFLTILTLASCRDRTSRKTPPTPPPSPIEVVTDAAQIESAKKAWADSLEQKLAALLADPSTFQTYDEESVELIKSQRERSVTSLTRTRDDTSQPAARRIRSVVALKMLGIAPDPTQLAEMAAGDEATLQLLSDLRDLYTAQEGLPPPLRPMVVRALDSKEERVRSQAAHWVGHYNLTEAAEVVVRRARSDPDAPMNFFRAAAKIQPTAEVLDVLLGRLRNPGSTDTYFVLSAVADLAEATRDPAARQRAADELVKHLKQVPDDPSIDAGTMAAIDTIASIPPEAAKPMLADLVRTARHRHVRNLSLGELHKLDASMAAQLSSETKVSLPRPSVPSSERKDVTPEQAAAACVRHNVLTQAEADAALAALAKLKRSRSQSPAARAEQGTVVETRVALGDADLEGGGIDDVPDAGAHSLLYAAKRFTWFDVETGMVPNRHDELILDLAKGSAGLFKPEAVLETYTEDGPDADTGKYAVQFVHGGKLYRFAPRDFGDWYDVEAVLAAVNRAVADAGLAERFVPLASEGQDATLIFADPTALAAAAPELGFKLGADPNEARQKGKAYEEQILEQFKRQ